MLEYPTVPTSYCEVTFAKDYQKQKQITCLLPVLKHCNFQKDYQLLVTRERNIGSFHMATDFSFSPDERTCKLFGFVQDTT